MNDISYFFLTGRILSLFLTLFFYRFLIFLFTSANFYAIISVLCASSSGDRVAHSECEGRRFDSCLAHQKSLWDRLDSTLRSGDIKDFFILFSLVEETRWSKRRGQQIRQNTPGHGGACRPAPYSSLSILVKPLPLPHTVST